MNIIQSIRRLMKLKPTKREDALWNLLLFIWLIVIFYSGYELIALLFAAALWLVAEFALSAGNELIETQKRHIELLKGNKRNGLSDIDQPKDYCED